MHLKIFGSRPYRHGPDRRSSQINTLLPKNICMKKITTCPNFTWYFLQKLTKCPNFTYNFGHYCPKNIFLDFFGRAGEGVMSPVRILYENNVFRVVMCRASGKGEWSDVCEFNRVQCDLFVRSTTTVFSFVETHQVYIKVSEAGGAWLDVHAWDRRLPSNGHWARRRFGLWLHSRRQVWRRRLGTRRRTNRSYHRQWYL